MSREKIVHQLHAPTRSKLESPPYIEQFRSKAMWNVSDIAELFHENTKYTAELGRKLADSAALFETDELQWIQDSINPCYRDAPPVDLPQPAASLDISLETALRERQSIRSYARDPVPVETVSTLFRYACGCLGSMPIEADGSSTNENTNFRTYPSGGALYPVEVYLASINCRDLSTGVYHYEPGTHHLRRIVDGDENFVQDLSETITSRPDVVSVEEAAAMVILSGSFWRSKAKYGPRGYRFVLQESGHLAQNLHLVATALDLGLVPLGSFHDGRLNELLGVDGVNEAVVYTLLLGEVDEGEH